jgi:hypothetical protein
VLIQHKRFVLPALGAAAALAAVPAAVSGNPAKRSSSSPSLSPSPARVQVTADEFRLALSRVSVRRGPAVIELFNLGEDDHDLAVRRIAPGARTLRVPVVGPGRARDLEARLSPGRYRLWCTLADHRARGMQAILVVRRR